MRKLTKASKHNRKQIELVQKNTKTITAEVCKIVYYNFVILITIP